MAWISLFQKALNLGKVYKTKNLLPDIDTMTNELYNTKLNISLFNSYTGNTSGSTIDISGKLDKIVFNQYTGDTKIVLNNKLDVSIFNQYTGSTDNNFSGVTVNKFNSYTAQTQSNLYNKLDKITFNTYTGNTNITLSNIENVTNISITGVTNGLTKSGSHNNKLGGALIEPTTISGDQSLTLGDLNGIHLSTKNTTDVTLNAKSGGGVYIKSQSGTTTNDTGFNNSVGLFLNYDSVSGFSIYDNRSGINQTGIIYNNDYSLNYVDRSLVDKAYVDSVATNLNTHAAVKVATLSGITLSGNQIIDGVNVINGDRVLVKNQINGALNGIYIVTGSTWFRAGDYHFNTGDITNGDLIPVLTGNTNINTIWILTTPNPIISGNSLNYSVFSRLLSVTAGNGIDVQTVNAARQISVKLSPSSPGLVFDGSGLEIDYNIFRKGLSVIGGKVDVKAPQKIASGSEINVNINTGGTNTLYVDSNDINTALGNPISNIKFNAFTGQTQSNLFNKLDKTIFSNFTGNTYTKQQINQYTGETQNNLFNKLDKSTFNSYTGNTNNKINHISGITDTKLAKTTFSTYTGNTQSVINFNTVQYNIPFTGIFKLDHENTYYNQYTGSTNIVLSANTNPTIGAFDRVVIVGDGTHTPVFTNLGTLRTGSDTYTNTIGTRNEIITSYIYPDGKIYSIKLI
jgi:hypothetical protein